MKTVLDLVQEFASLDDTKTRSGGILPPPSERRWAEVKAFYDLVMVQSGLPERRGRRFTASEIDQSWCPGRVFACGWRSISLSCIRLNTALPG